MNLGPYSKTVSALVTGLIGWGGVVVSSVSNHVTASEWLFLAVVVATALGVYAVPNGPAQVQVVNPPEDPANVVVNPDPPVPPPDVDPARPRRR
jgi:hypothetical protein